MNNMNNKLSCQKLECCELWRLTLFLESFTILSNADTKRYKSSHIITLSNLQGCRMQDNSVKWKYTSSGNNTLFSR